MTKGGHIWQNYSKKLCLRSPARLARLRSFLRAVQTVPMAAQPAVTETVEYLAVRGADVSIVEMMPKIAAGESATVLPSIRESFAVHGVKEYVNTKLEEIMADRIVCTDTARGEKVEIPADFVVMAVGAKSNPFNAEGITAEIKYCGDCADRPSDISHAIRSAYDAANSIL